MKRENGFWKVCEALDCWQRIKLLRHLIEIEKTEFPCVNELAEAFHVSSATMSVHLKKLSVAGLVSSKQGDRRVYYRAFPTTKEGERVVGVLQRFFATSPNERRMHDLERYVRALSHERRHAIVRCLAENPGMEIKPLSMRMEMPPATTDRLLGDLNKARIVDMNLCVAIPDGEPEATLLKLTLA